MFIHVESKQVNAVLKRRSIYFQGVGTCWFDFVNQTGQFFTAAAKKSYLYLAILFQIIFYRG
jgi:hypothetical protein